MVPTSSTIKRGALIVLEGCDRCGKSTQTKRLFEELQRLGISVKQLGFPDRKSATGQVINTYLTNKQNLTDEGIHLLFTANRWEARNEMRALLEAGNTLVVDRYSFSGVAYSVAKGLDYEWCWSPEKGLLRPDVVFYLKTPIETLLQRGDFGVERYEKEDFQRRVADVFERICVQEHNYWQPIDAAQSMDAISTQIVQKAVAVLQTVADKPLTLLE